jgi:hypothetical protein
MIILVTGIPRSGSMWTYNVTRALLQSGSQRIIPQDIPQDETIILNEAFMHQQTKDVIYCIKTHHQIYPNNPNVKIIFTYRDFCESIVSFMRFTRCDFERAMELLPTMLMLTDYYFEKHTSNIIRLSYNRIIDEPIKVIEQISSFLDVSITSKDSQHILQQFSKENIKKFIESFNSIKITQSGEIEDLELRKEFETVLNNDGSYRLYHKKTGYQSNHITNQAEQWKEAITAEQQKHLSKAAHPWLIKYGFKI